MLAYSCIIPFCTVVRSALRPFWLTFLHSVPLCCFQFLLMRSDVIGVQRFHMVLVVLRTPNWLLVMIRLVFGMATRSAFSFQY